MFYPNSGIVDPSCPVNWANSLTRGLVSWWKVVKNSGWRGGLTWRDLVRGGKTPNDGTLVNGPTWSGNTPRGGFGSLLFDNSNHIVVISAQPTFTEYTFACFGSSLGSGGSVPMMMSDEYEGTELRNFFGSLQATNGSVSTAGAFIDNIGWFHAACTANATELKLYFNGNQSGSTGTITAFKSPGAVGIGNRNTNRIFGWNGWLDNAMIFSRALSASEVADLYQETLRGCPNMLNYISPKVYFGPISSSGEYTKDLTAILNSSAVLIKEPRLIKTTALNLTNSLQKLLARLLSDSVTLSATMLKQPNKVLFGSLGESGQLIKQCQKVLSESLGSSTAFVKSIYKTLTDSISLSGDFDYIKVLVRLYTASVTLGGAVIKQCGKGISGGITGSGSLLKLVGRLLTGSISLGGVFDKLKLLVRSFTGSITNSGSLTKQANKVLSGTLNLSATVVKGLSRLVSGSISFAGNCIKNPNKTLSGSVSNNGVLLKVGSKLLNGTLSLSGNTIKSISRLLTGSVTLSASLIKRIGKLFVGVASFLGSLNVEEFNALIFYATITCGGTIQKQTNKLFAVSTSCVGSLAKLIGRTLTAILSAAGLLTTSSQTGDVPIIYSNIDLMYEQSNEIDLQYEQNTITDFSEL